MINKIKTFAGRALKNTAVMYIMVLGLTCLVGLFGIRPLMLSESSAASTAKKSLPIYCVDRDDNKIAISFDAAWGAYRLRRNFTHCV